MSSKAGFRSKAREQSKGIRASLKQELRLLHSNPEGFVIVQFIKLVNVANRMMDGAKFKEMLKHYVETDELPKIPEE